MTGKLAQSKKYNSLLRNHLEGKIAGFIFSIYKYTNNFLLFIKK